MKSEKSHVRTALQLESARAENEKLRGALVAARNALERVRPQVTGALVVQDVENALACCRIALDK